MVNTEKVRLMTKAAIFEGREKNGAIRIVTFRRKDYILSRMRFRFQVPGSLPGDCRRI